MNIYSIIRQFTPNELASFLQDISIDKNHNMVSIDHYSENGFGFRVESSHQNMSQLLTAHQSVEQMRCMCGAYMSNYEPFSTQVVCVESGTESGFTKGEIYEVRNNVVLDDWDCEIFYRNPAELENSGVIGDAVLEVINEIDNIESRNYYTGWVYCREVYDSSTRISPRLTKGKIYHVINGYMIDDGGNAWGDYSSFEDFYDEGRMGKYGCWIEVNYKGELK